MHTNTHVYSKEENSHHFLPSNVPNTVFHFPHKPMGNLTSSNVVLTLTTTPPHYLSLFSVSIIQ